MSDPIDEASHQEELSNHAAVQASRPTPEEVDAFWRKIEEFEKSATSSSGV